MHQFNLKTNWTLLLSFIHHCLQSPPSLALSSSFTVLRVPVGVFMRNLEATTLKTISLTNAKRSFIIGSKNVQPIVVTWWKYSVLLLKLSYIENSIYYAYCSFRRNK